MRLGENKGFQPWVLVVRVPYILTMLNQSKNMTLRSQVTVHGPVRSAMSKPAQQLYYRSAPSES